jgi:hypothetical protein
MGEIFMIWQNGGLGGKVVYEEMSEFKCIDIRNTKETWNITTRYDYKTSDLQIAYYTFIIIHANRNRHSEVAMPGHDIISRL